MSQNNLCTVIKPRSKFLNFNFSEIWKFRDLLWLFVKRDIVVVYKQTILGPLWYIIQPILTTIMFTFVFGKLANISTDGIPPILFYLLGVTIWGYFAECLAKTSNTFISNQNIFGKVYFPRVIMPASIVISNLLKILIQFTLFLGIWVYYLMQGAISPNFSYTLLLPIIIFIMALISLGFGMLFSSLTTKYRDMTFLLTFGIQLWMYATPIIYPTSTIPQKYLWLVNLNPISHLVESMRFAFLGKGDFSVNGLMYSFSASIIILFFGYFIFSKVEKNFMDTV